MVSRKKVAVGMTLAVMVFLFVLVVLSMFGGSDMYTPVTDDGAVIFAEACARCHGERGLGGAGIGPRLAGRREAQDEVQERVEEGKGRMPRFPNVRGQALANLAAYVHGL